MRRQTGAVSELSEGQKKELTSGSREMKRRRATWRTAAGMRRCTQQGGGGAERIRQGERMCRKKEQRDGDRRRGIRDLKRQKEKRDGERESKAETESRASE